MRGTWRYALSIYLLATAVGGVQAEDQKPGETASTSKTRTTSQPLKIEPRKEVIIVTGTFAPIPAQDVDRAVSSIAATENSLLYDHWTSYLEMVPSVDLRQRGTTGTQADLSIRGSNFGQTLVLLNGLRMNDVHTGHHNLDLPLPTESLERIEVLRGGGSTFYGSDAVGGTVNFITAPPKYSELEVGTAVGNLGINQQTLSASFLRRKWDEQLTVSRDFSSGFRPDRDYRNFSVYSNSGLQTGLGRTLVMLGYADKPFGADQFYGDFPSWERTKTWFAGLKQDLGANTEFDFGYRRHSDEFILVRDNPSIYENNHISEEWQTAIRRKQALGKNATLFYGGEGFHESIVSNNLGDHARSRGAVYVDYDVRAWKRFSFSMGAREEILNSTHGEFTPTIAAGVWLRSGLKLKASVSRAFRLPSYTDLYYQDPNNHGDPNLQPESAWSYEGGLQWDHGGRVRAEVTVFHRWERNDIDYVSNSPTGPWQAANIDRLNFTGVETSLEVRLPRRQTVGLVYTGLHGAQEPLPGLDTKYSASYPIHEAAITWHGALPGKLLARSRLGVIDRFQQIPVGVTNQFQQTPYAIWDAAIGREFHHVAAHLQFSNITSTQYQEIQGVIMPGRSVIFGLDFFLKGKQ